MREAGERPYSGFRMECSGQANEQASRQDRETSFRELGQRWREESAAQRYSRRRWRSPQAANRDPRIVSRILQRYGGTRARGAVLDVPCGVGRLRAVIESELEGDTHGYLGVDLALPMLSEAARAGARRLCAASVERLPFRDDSFEVVVCCRLLHHLGGGAALSRALSELVRVSNRLVVASFFDAGSWHAARRRWGWRKQSSRSAISKTHLAGMVAAAGAEVLSFHHSFRYVSQQTFFVAGKTDRQS